MTPDIELEGKDKGEQTEEEALATENSDNGTKENSPALPEAPAEDFEG